MLHFLPNSPPTDRLLSSPPTDDRRSPITENGLRGVTETLFRGCPRIGGERNTVSRLPPGAPPQHPWGPWATPEGLQTRFGVPGGVGRPWATPEALQTRFGVSGFGFAKFYSSTTFCSSHGRHTCVADKKKGGCFDGCYPSAEILTTRPTPALSHAHAYSLGMP